jgi:hypothetical protein
VKIPEILLEKETVKSTVVTSITELKDPSVIPENM